MRSINYFFILFFLLTYSSYTLAQATATEEINNANSALTPKPDDPIPTTETTEQIPPPAPSEPPMAVDKPKVVSEEELLKPSEDFLQKKTTKIPETKVKSTVTRESELYLQDALKYKISEKSSKLRLMGAIEEALRKNGTLKSKFIDHSINDFNYLGVRNHFWLPELKLTLNTSLPPITNKLGVLNNTTTYPAPPNSTSPTGVFSLGFSDYTIFNWGKDYALLENAKELNKREQIFYQELLRELKLDVIAKFFEISSLKNIVKFRLDQLRQASFIYRLNKEKVIARKISQQDYYLSRSEYLNAQTLYHEAKALSDTKDQELALLIGDESNKKYILSEDLDYRILRINLNYALATAAENNPITKNLEVNLKSAERLNEIAQKENLPLPKISLSLGAYTKTFGASNNLTNYNNYNNGRQMDITAGIDATWSITGTDGFFNSYKLAKGQLTETKAQHQLNFNKLSIEHFINSTYRDILSLQNQILILEAAIPTQKTTLDLTIDEYQNKRSKFSDFHQALVDYYENKIKFETSKWLHLKAKVDLLKYMGVEDFPGENLEKLALSASEK